MGLRKINTIGMRQANTIMQLWTCATVTIVTNRNFLQ